MKETADNIDIARLREYIRGVEECPADGSEYPRGVYTFYELFPIVGDYLEIVDGMKGKLEPEEMDLLEAEAMLTYIIRGERFCDGHIAQFIRNGMLLRVLRRLEVLVSESER